MIVPLFLTATNCLPDQTTPEMFSEVPEFWMCHRILGELEESFHHAVPPPAIASTAAIPVSTLRRETRRGGSETSTGGKENTGLCRTGCSVLHIGGTERSVTLTPVSSLLGCGGCVTLR